MERLNAGEGMVILPPVGYSECDLQYAGYDATGEFIDPVLPGPDESSGITKLLSNTWVVTIAGGVIVVILGTLVVRWLWPGK